MGGKLAMIDKPEVRLPPERYQPAKREVLEDVSIDATPDELAGSVLRPVNVVRSRQAHPGKSD